MVPGKPATGLVGREHGIGIVWQSMEEEAEGDVCGWWVVGGGLVRAGRVLQRARCALGVRRPLE